MDPTWLWVTVGREERGWQVDRLESLKAEHIMIQSLSNHRTNTGTSEKPLERLPVGGGDDVDALPVEQQGAQGQSECQHFGIAGPGAWRDVHESSRSEQKG